MKTDAMEIIVIAAMAANRVIGKDNAIPWHIPGEQLRFKATTMGHTLVMGRKTFESIGRPLPGRKNIVISRQQDFKAPGCMVVNDLAVALKLAGKDEKVFVIGGGHVYAQALPLADRIILTVLERAVEGNVYFPEFSAQEFCRFSVEHFDEPEPYHIADYRRRHKP